MKILFFYVVGNLIPDRPLRRYDVCAVERLLFLEQVLMEAK
jgi:hypothetical protein